MDGNSCDVKETRGSWGCGRVRMASEKRFVGEKSFAKWGVVTENRPETANLWGVKGRLWPGKIPFNSAVDRGLEIGPEDGYQNNGTRVIRKRLMPSGERGRLRPAWCLFTLKVDSLEASPVRIKLALMHLVKGLEIGLRAVFGPLGGDLPDVVADNRERTNVLVLAGPGSGKTRVLVHRIAYLIRVRRENPGSILALTYNRHAAVEARRRLDKLNGKDARGVNVMTCHALAMRILGVSFAQVAANPGDETFATIFRDAAHLLRSNEANAFVTREQMLGRLHWILVDEYQDIGEPEYELIAALAGETLAEDDARSNLFAVGDDDQNIYAWKGASVRFIHRFAQEYHAKEEYLVENYRSTRFIIDASSRCIDSAAERRKRDHRLRIDAQRQVEPPGGAWTFRDNVAQVKVQILHLKGGQLSQAVAAVEELKRLAELDPDWQWNRCAIVARNWADLDPVRSACMVHGIPVQSAREELSSFWRARQTQRFLHTLEASDSTAIEAQEIRRYREETGGDPWADLLAQALDELLLEEGQATALPIAFVRNWLGEWSKEIRRRQQGLLLTSAHRAKGLEFDHVIILDGRWGSASDAEDPDTPRRLYYVSMTRACETLALVQLDDASQPHVRDRPLKARRDERAATLLQSVRNDSSVLEREAPCPDLSDQRLDIRIKECTMKDVVLSFAGWRTAQNDCHRAITALSPGDRLCLSN